MSSLARCARHVILAMLASLALPHAPAAAQSDPSAQSGQPARAFQQRHDVRDLLPIGDIKVDIMEAAPPPRFTELKTKLEQAVRRDTAFFAAYLRTAKPQPDAALPYHPKMGITEDEYAEMLTLPNEEGLRKIGEATLVVRESTGHLLLDGGDPLPAVRNVDIDLDRNLVTTSLGELADCSLVEPGFLAQAVTGPWAGVQWKMTGAIAALVSFGVGRLEDSGRGILVYEMKYVDDAGHVGAMRTVLVYDLPRHEASR